jgi:hypothetical protein
MMSLCFKKSFFDTKLYYHIVGDELLILVLYVDELFLMSSESTIVECKNALDFEIEMKYLCMMH